MPFAKWRARLAGQSVPTHTQPDENDEGYYRKKVTRKGVDAKGQPNGKNILVGWRPIAYFMQDGELVALIDGNKRLTTNQAEELWTYAVQNPISYELYRDVTENGKPWPDMPEPEASIPAANRDVDRSDNNPPEDLPLDQQHKTAIDSAVSAAAGWLIPGAIKTEQDAAIAFGSKNRIAELRLDAKKAGEAIYEPIYRQYKAEQAKWAPIVKTATDAEADLNVAVLQFREIERRRIAAERAEAERKAAIAEREAREEAARIAELNARAADRAIAAGEPEPEPEVIEEPEPPPAAPLPTQAPLAPTYGKRKPREQVKKFATVVDGAKVYEHFKGNADLIALLHKLAETAVRAGLDVPGTTVREGLV